jgi:hypothetical protein
MLAFHLCDFVELTSKKSVNLWHLKMKNSEFTLIEAVDWIINGGESGANRRPFDTDWGRVLRDQSNENSVPFFFKQVDKKLPIPEDLMVREFTKIINLKK